ncbi:hypothetical protein EEA47_03175 [Vibrio alginolyticus]|uniref:hypothetical protein n=1 Tax=Vibrio alginolyticus TaxID=663 RepID=UPI00227BE35A|nr:hypothetical protein [Vibrio alginolyticus]WAG25465.1 hypothetical protein EEA47_03175 [Vibrio alginolyticus]
MSKGPSNTVYWFLFVSLGLLLAWVIDSEIWLGQIVILVVFLVNFLPISVSYLSKYKAIARDGSALFVIGALVGLIFF